MVKWCADDSAAKAEATAWLLKRGTGAWKKFGMAQALKEKGIYDPAKITVQPITVPAPPKDSKLPPLKDILALDGNAERGKITAMRCASCHEVNGAGVNYAPNLRGWGKGQTAEVIARSIVNPSADIAHGYKGTVVTLKDGGEVHGITFGSTKADPFIIQSTGGITQLIPKGKIAKIGTFNRSLMLTADQLALTSQDVADLVAFLKGYE
jgi:putative heme-binding domain-containing protein